MIEQNHGDMKRNTNAAAGAPRWYASYDITTDAVVPVLWPVGAPFKLPAPNFESKDECAVYIKETFGG